MRIQRVRKKTFGHIEQELFFYHDTKKQIATIRDQIIHGRGVVDNPEGGKSNLPGDPTASKAMRLEGNKLLNNMQEIVDAIETLYQSSSGQQKRFIEAFYWKKPQTLTLEGIAQNLFMSRRTIYRVRHRIVYKIATELGWW